MPIAPKPKRKVWQHIPERSSSWSSYGKNTFNYHSKEWRSLRVEIIKDQPICVSCKAKGLITLTKVIDHIIPVQEYKGSPLDKTNLQGLCKECDDIKRGQEIQNRLKK